MTKNTNYRYYKKLREDIGLSMKQMIYLCDKTKNNGFYFVERKQKKIANLYKRQHNITLKDFLIISRYAKKIGLFDKIDFDLLFKEFEIDAKTIDNRIAKIIKEKNKETE
jgi:hypothetical protein